jgi:hypothetical protein
VQDENEEPTLLTDPEVYKMARQIQADFEKGTLKAAQMDSDQVDTSSDTQGANGKGQRAAEVL